MTLVAITMWEMEKAADTGTQPAGTLIRNYVKTVRKCYPTDLLSSCLHRCDTRLCINDVR